MPYRLSPGVAVKYASLVWVGLRRSRARTILTLLSAIVAFLLFGILNGVGAYLNQAVERAHLDILVTNSAGGPPMPFPYLARIQSVAGVKSTAYLTQAGGYYRTPRNGLAIMATDPGIMFRTISEMQSPEGDKKAIGAIKIGALVTPALARKYGWKRGDIISIHADKTPQKNGSADWRFQVVGFLHIDAFPDAPILMANYSYFDAARATDTGTVQQVWTLISNPGNAGVISNAIDGMFVNSPVQTRTMSQKDATQSALARVGNIAFFLNAIIAAVFFTLLLLVGNALMQSFRERIREFAVMKTLGFSDNKIAALVMAEALALCVAAAFIGLTVAWVGLPLFGKATGGFLPHPPWIVAVLGMIVALLIGLVCGAIPAWKASRLTIVGGLARP